MNVGDTTKDGKTISRIEKIVGVRKMTIANLQASIQNTVPVSGFTHADVSGVVRLHEKCKEAGYKVSVTEIFVKILAMALEKHPELNCSHVENEIHYYSSINMGVAVGLPNGMLIVPVIHNCENKSLLQISADMKGIMGKVKKNELSMDMMTGGTFTLTSIGMFGVDSTDPILNVPQSGILAVGRIEKQPVVLEDDSIGITSKAFLTITVDHAVVNGAPASKYVQTIAEYAKNADQLIAIE